MAATPRIIGGDGGPASPSAIIKIAEADPLDSIINVTEPSEFQ